MLAQGLRCPPTSSMGRWFDAAAALLRVRETSAYEGQAPMLLEALAGDAQARASASELSALVPVLADGTLDPTPLLERLADEDDSRRGAALFHARARRRPGPLGRAGCRIERPAHRGAGRWLLPECLLTGLLVRRLEALDLHVLEARQAPPNDGGIALGQAWVAICKMSEGV